MGAGPPAPAPAPAPADIERLVVALHRRYGLAEGVLPEQRARVVGDFVQPELSLGGGAAERLSWGGLCDRPRLLVCGEAGAGKTMLLRHWMLRHADRTRRGESEILPLCLPLRHFAPRDTVEDALRREAFDVGAIRLGRGIRTFAGRGLIAVAMDGLDEVPGNRREAIAAKLAEFMDRFPRCPCLLTARPHAAPSEAPRLLRADILPFDPARARQTAYHRLFESGGWKDFAARLEAEPALRWIATNPLALSLVLARVLRAELSLRDVSEIVADVVDLFAGRWDSARGVVRGGGAVLSPERKRRALARVAAGRPPSLEPPVEEEAALAALADETGLLIRASGSGWRIRDDGIADYLRADRSLRSVSSNPEAFLSLLRSPLSRLGAMPLRFTAAMAADSAGFLDRALAGAGAGDFGLAVRLTEIFSERVPVGAATLSAYARLVATVLDAPLRLARAIVRPGAAAAACAIPGDVPGEADEVSVVALLRALHGSRGGPGAAAVEALIGAGGHPHLEPVGALLRAEGAFEVERREGALIWEVTEILPGVPGGPAGCSGEAAPA